MAILPMKISPHITFMSHSGRSKQLTWLARHKYRAETPNQAQDTAKRWVQDNSNMSTLRLQTIAIKFIVFSSISSKLYQHVFRRQHDEFRVHLFFFGFLNFRCVCASSSRRELDTKTRLNSSLSGKNNYFSFHFSFLWIRLLVSSNTFSQIRDLITIDLHAVRCGRRARASG